jgi:hypothetical protein
MTDTNTPGERQTPLTDDNLIMDEGPHPALCDGKEIVYADFARKLETALAGLKIVDCWCSEAARTRDFNGDHSPACKAARSALGGEGL